MRWKDIPFHPEKKTLRVFAAAWTVLLCGFAIWQYFREDREIAAMTLGALALAIGVLGCAFPSLLRPIFVGWIILIFPLNWLVSHVLLAFIFFLMVTPLGLFFKLIGRDFLGRRFRRDQESYWAAKPNNDDAESYLRPF